MEIIFYGRVLEDTTREFSCMECSSVMRAKVSELGAIHPDQRDGDYYMITCPVCKSKIYLDVAAVRNNTLYTPRDKTR